MGIFDQYRQNLTDTTFGVFGKAAAWTQGGDPRPVTIRLKTPDVIEAFGHSRAIMPTVLVEVRTSEVAAPAEGDIVQAYLDDDRTQPDGLPLKIIAEPQMLDPYRRYWSCQAVRVQP